MSYRYTLEDLLCALHPTAPVQVEAVSATRRRVEHGLLSVGLKIHCLGGGEQFADLVQELGGAQNILDVNLYRKQQASLCLVLPPVGNARTAIRLLECVEYATGAPVFDSDEIQIQVCSPGRLTPVRSAMLAIVFYLGSDTIRRYTMADFETTFSDAAGLHPLIKQGERGKRLVIYDAPWGTFDDRFEWWRRRQVNRLHRRHRLPFSGDRTDVITAKSRVDIRNINLAATLLCHAQYDGYWAALGTKFEKSLQDILHAHLLDNLLYASWLHASEETKEGDREFILALTELMSYAIDDSFRVRRHRKDPAKPPGILSSVKTLLQDMRAELVAQSFEVQRGGVR